jgi:hypothetical protein
MRRPGGSQRAERSDLPAIETESTEDLFLAPREVRSDAAQTSRHLERPHSEVGAGFVPMLEKTIGHVVSHAIHCSAQKSLTLVSCLRDT